MKILLKLFFILFPIMVNAGDTHFDNSVNIEAEKISYNGLNNRIIEASGNVHIIQGNKTLLADKVIYNITLDKVIAKGNVTIFEENGIKINSKDLELTNSFKQGIINSLTLIFPDKSILMADQALRENENIMKLDRGMYTPCSMICNVTEPLWKIRAGRVEFNRHKEEVTYKNAFLDIKGFPILYTPYFSHATPGILRKTGLLSPTIINNTYLGKSIRVPYYFNIAPDKDFTLFSQVTSKRGAILGGEYRQLFGNGQYQINGSITKREVLKDDKDESNKNLNNIRSHLYAVGDFKLKQNLEAGFNINLTSDKTYIKNYSLKKNKHLDVDIFISKLYADYYKNYDFIKIQGLYFQNLRPIGEINDTPFILPYIKSHYEAISYKNGANIFFDTNILSLYRKKGVGINRVSITSGWKKPYISDYGYILTLSSSLRGDIYRYNIPQNNNLKNGKNFSRAIPEVKLDWKIPLVRQYDDSSVVLEPLGNIVFSPNKNYNKKVYNEDSQYIELNDSNLFSQNRYTGLDYVEYGTRSNYGLKSSIYNKFNSKINLMIGQTYTSYDKKFSDFVGRLSGSYKESTDIRYKFTLDKFNYKVKRHEIYFRQNYKPFVFNIEYIIFNDNVLDSNNVKNKKEIFFEGTIEDYKGWTFSLNARRNLTNRSDDPKLEKGVNRMIRVGAGAFRKDECIEYSLSFERDYTKMLGKSPSNTWWARVWLKNLM